MSNLTWFCLNSYHGSDTLLSWNGFVICLTLSVTLWAPMFPSLPCWVYLSPFNCSGLDQILDKGPCFNVFYPHMIFHPNSIYWSDVILSQDQKVKIFCLVDFQNFRKPFFSFLMPIILQNLEHKRHMLQSVKWLNISSKCLCVKAPS